MPPALLPHDSPHNSPLRSQRVTCSHPEPTLVLKFLTGSLNAPPRAGDPKGSPPKRTSARVFRAGDPKGSPPKRTSARVERAGDPKGSPRIPPTIATSDEYRGMDAAERVGRRGRMPPRGERVGGRRTATAASHGVGPCPTATGATPA